MIQIMPKIEDFGRLIGSVIFFIIGITIIIFGWKKEIPLFYDRAQENINDWIRILWCISFAFIGFSIAAYRASKTKHGPSGEAWKIYPTIYLINLIMLSILIFAFLHISKQTSNYLFYFLSAPVSFLLSWYIDVWIGYPIDLIKKLK